VCKNNQKEVLQNENLKGNMASQIHELGVDSTIVDRRKIDQHKS
jgi:hypothetical protein